MGSFQWPQSRIWSTFLVLVSGCFSGLLFWWSIPRTDIQWCAWICLVPCFVVSAIAPRNMAAASGLVAGLVAGSGRVYWITETLQLYGGLSLPVGLCSNALLVSYLALYSACFFYLCSRLCFTTPLFAWTAASLWILLEWVQTWFITGFPWELLGYSQYLNRPLVQLASATGVYGLSFLIALVNAVLAQILIRQSGLLKSGLPPALLVGAALAFGYYRLEVLEEESGEPLEIGIVQGNFPQDEKWKGDWRNRTVQRYVELTRSLAANRRLDLIVFPETALPIYFRDPYFAPQSRPITDLARELGVPLLVGSLEGQGKVWPKKVYNRAFLLDGQGLIQDFSDKVHLVPFGEYLPLPFLFQYLEGLTAESGIFTPGAAHKLLNLPEQNRPFGVFVCYESIFPEITRTLTRLGASFLINITNDAWFGRSAAPYQHFSMAVLRAVETGRPVLRAANTGISGLIGPDGRIIKATELFETTAFVVRVQPRTEPTLYTRYGDILLVLCALFLASVGMAHWRTIRRQWSRASC